MHQVDEIPVAVREKHQAIPLVVAGLAQELHSGPPELFVRRVEIVHQDGQVPYAGVFHLLCGTLPFGSG